MPEIKHQGVRRHVRAELARFNKQFQVLGSERARLSDVDALLRVPRARSKEAKAACYQHLSEDLSIVNLAIACIAFMSLAAYGEGSEDELFPVDWLAPDGVPNANLVTSCMLTQLANYSLATVELVEKGLDTPARATLRCALELSLQLLVVLSDRGTFQAYARAPAEKPAKRVWYELFAQERIHRKMASLERSIGLPEELVLMMRGVRIESIEFLSEAVHHSFMATTVGSFALSYEDDGISSSGLFGGANGASIATVSHLRDALWHFTLTFFPVLARIHGIRPKNASNEFWTRAIFLQSCVNTAYLQARAREKS